MGKVKQANGKAAKASKPLSAVKNAGVTKATDSPKAKSKQIAKDVASKAVKGKDLKKKKKVESESEDSESDSDSNDSESDDASGSSDEDSDDSTSESEEKPAAKAKASGKAAKPVANGKTNGKAKAKAAKSESEDSSDSDEDSDDSDDAADAKPTADKAKAKKEVCQFSKHITLCLANVYSSHRLKTPTTLILPTLLMQRKVLMTLAMLSPRLKRSLSSRRSVRPKMRPLHPSRRPRQMRSLRRRALLSSSETSVGLWMTRSCTTHSRIAPTLQTLVSSLTKPCNALVVSDTSTLQTLRLLRLLSTR